MRLMIVESPNKIKKIQSYLGEGWIVAASVGHIRDLPEKDIGVTPPDFKPNYVISPDKKSVVTKLKALAAKASEVYLATDPDREGEAISYHLRVALGLKAHKRVTFNEITKKAITQAVESARQIDNKLVAAQEARRVLDRLFGYTLSPILSQQSGIKLSAGRVQSVAVKIVVMREREIKEFRKRNFYVLQAELSTGLSMELSPKPFAENGKHIFDLSLIQRIAEHAKSIKINDITTEPKEIKPRPPFTTSTLQQAASATLKMSPADTMKNAQSLFEQGAITYHRTDSPNLSGDGFTAATSALRAMNIEHQQTQIKYVTKDSAQEAHEAIRPTTFASSAGETIEQQKLYSLILERTLTSVMNPGIDDVTTIRGSIPEPNTDEMQKAVFTASGKITRSAGWRSLAKLEPYQSKETALTGDAELGMTYHATPSIITKQTEPPSRFTEATLIKALEALGVGRPSTYASIMENIKNREYISIATKGTATISPTATGIAVVDALNEMPFMRLDYTAEMESQLDRIAVGKAAYLPTVSNAYSDLASQLHSIKIGLLVNTAPCPLCGEPLKRIKGEHGHYWIHAIQGASDSCVRSLKDEKGNPVLQKPITEITKDCPKCGEMLVQKTSKTDASKKFWMHKVDTESCDKFVWDN